jgi:hypothetical protein
MLFGKSHGEGAQTVHLSATEGMFSYGKNAVIGI